MTDKHRGAPSTHRRLGGQIRLFIHIRKCMVLFSTSTAAIVRSALPRQARRGGPNAAASPPTVPGPEAV